MSMWTMIALVSITAIIAGIFTDKGKRKHSEEATEEIRKLHARVDALETDIRDRVETLERIVTNPKEDLKRQFDHLDKAS